MNVCIAECSIYYRLKNLEEESSVINEQYQRYIRTHYRDLMQSQSVTRTDKGLSTYVNELATALESGKIKVLCCC